MKLEVLKCPSCGANIEFEDGVESCECEYCGAVITIAPSLNNKNIVMEPSEKFTASTHRPTATKTKDKISSEEGIARKIIKWILNAFFVVNILFTGIFIIVTISERDIDMLFAALFTLIYAVMFRVLAITPKGSKYVLGKEKGIKPIYFVLICVFLSFLVMMLSPSAEINSDTDIETNEKTVISEQSVE